MNETLHRKNIPGIHDYNLRILRDSQRLGIAIVATVLLIATIITNVSSFIANFKRSVLFTDSFVQFSGTEFCFSTFQKYSSDIPCLFIFVGLQRSGDGRFYLYNVHFANDQ